MAAVGMVGSALLHRSVCGYYQTCEEFKVSVMVVVVGTVKLYACLGRGM